MQVWTGWLRRLMYQPVAEPTAACLPPLCCHTSRAAPWHLSSSSACNPRPVKHMAATSQTLLPLLTLPRFQLLPQWSQWRWQPGKATLTVLWWSVRGPRMMLLLLPARYRLVQQEMMTCRLVKHTAAVLDHMLKRQRLLQLSMSPALVQ
ncbi:hypothetical protein V8C86DRAFT_2736748 [Haematococcus lacustris]